MNYTPVRYHLVEAMLSDPKGSWTIRALTERVSTRVTVSVSGVQDSLYLFMAHNLLEAVPFQAHLTLRLRTDPAKPLNDTATAVERLTELLTSWRDQHGSIAGCIPD